MYLCPVHKEKLCCYTNVPLVLPSIKSLSFSYVELYLKCNKFTEHLFREQFQICSKFKEARLGHNHFVLNWIQHTLCKMHCVSHTPRQ